jgi:ERO1-like protein beta
VHSSLYSPRLNANLLQRSEVVALINTLHRFSESLHSVEVFRRLWRETNAEESENLIREAEKAVNTPVGLCREPRCLVLMSFQLSRPTQAASEYTLPTADFVEALQRRVKLWVRTCKEGTIECANMVKEAVQRIFGIPGKEQGPRTEL